MSNENSNTVFILFEKDYHLWYVGVFSSERAACEYVISHGLGGGYVLKAVDVDTNDKKEVSDGVKDFLHWMDWESFDDDDLFDHMSYAEAMRIIELRAQAKLIEVFGE